MQSIDGGHVMELYAIMSIPYIPHCLSNLHPSAFGETPAVAHLRKGEHIGYENRETQGVFCSLFLLFQGCRTGRSPYRTSHVQSLRSGADEHHGEGPGSLEGGGSLSLPGMGCQGNRGELRRREKMQ